MKVRTNDFKNQIKLPGRELDARITYENNGQTFVLTGEDINTVTSSFHGNLLKSVMKELEIDSNVDIPMDTIIHFEFGIKVNDSYEYLNFGNYIVYLNEKQEDLNSYKISCYDKMLYTMKTNEDLNITYPITIREYIQALCNKLDFVFANSNDEFTNYERIIGKELYFGLDYTYRDIFDELAQVTASTICLNNNDELEIRYINETNDIVNEEYLKDINVNFGQKYGPINSIVLSRSAESDNVFLQDEESIANNGLCEIKIVDNQIMNWNDRSDYLPELLERLNGIEYFLNDFASTGICYYDLCDKYNIQIDGAIFPCIMLNDEIEIDQGIVENVYTDILNESETDYTKADKTDRRINQTYLIVDKQNKSIEALVGETKEVKENLESTNNNIANNYYQKSQVEQMVLDSSNGLTNTFSEAGGNNILRNTNFSAKEVLEEGQIYEYWYGNTIRQSSNSSANGYSILLQNNTLYQEQNLADGSYTLSFFYKKLNSLANVFVKVNGKQYELTEESNYKLFQTGVKGENDTYIVEPITITDNHIKVEFITDINNSCEIYDIMLNAGKVKLAYSQNQNETITDTVNIGKGMTIQNSAEEVKFVANHNKIGFKDSSNNFTTDFGPKGTNTNELNVRNEATVVGILRQKVGDQIWDCMI